MRGKWTAISKVRPAVRHLNYTVNRDSFEDLTMVNRSASLWHSKFLKSLTVNPRSFLIENPAPLIEVLYRILYVNPK